MSHGKFFGRRSVSSVRQAESASAGERKAAEERKRERYEAFLRYKRKQSQRKEGVNKQWNPQNKAN